MSAMTIDSGLQSRVADVASEDGALRSPLSGMFPRDLPLPESLSAALLPVQDQVDPHRVPPATPACLAYRVD